MPADVVLLRTSDPNGVVYLRTDQLDGETDWKLRRSVPQKTNPCFCLFLHVAHPYVPHLQHSIPQVPCTQRLPSESALSGCSATIVYEEPSDAIDEFEGELLLHDGKQTAEGGEAPHTQESLALEHVVFVFLRPPTHFSHMSHPTFPISHLLFSFFSF